MDLTPQTLRQVEFREKLRGYHPDDVDDFLEEVAVSLEGLLARLQTAEAAARAVPPSEVAPVAAVAGTSIAGEIGVTEETIRRTLLLAQKTADAAIADAQESAHQILTSSQEEAQRLLEETKASVTTMTRDAKVNAQAAITELEGRRASLERDLSSLQAFASQQRDRLRDVLSDQMRALDVWLSTAPAGGAKPPVSRPADAATPSRPPETGGLGSPGGQGRPAEGVVPPPPVRPGGREFPNDRGRDAGPPAGAPRAPVEDSFGGPRPDRPAEGAARPGFARTPATATGPRRRPDLGDAAPTDEVDEGGASGPGRHAARSDAAPAIPLGPPGHDDFAADTTVAAPDEPEAPDVFDQETTHPADDDAAPGGQRGGRLFKRN